MAISIDWSTKVISIPRTDLTLIQLSPTEVRELNTDAFRLELKALEATFYGMAYEKTHTHNPPVQVGGVELSRVIEIINGYTITFEDGQYAVNLQGSNSNIADVVNVNQVSIRSGNSAGLVTSSAIEFGSFNGRVHVDAINGVQTTTYPAGTSQQPVKSMALAHIVAERRGFDAIEFIGNYTFGPTDFYSDYEIYGQNVVKTTLTFEYGSILNRCEFYEAKLTGSLTGPTVIERCHLADFNVSGLIASSVEVFIKECLLEGQINIPPNFTGKLRFIDCSSDTASVAQIPTINYQGAAADVIIREYYGRMILEGFSGNSIGSVDLSSGAFEVADTCTNGVIIVRGIGEIINNSGGTVVNSSHLLQVDKLPTKADVINASQL